MKKTYLSLMACLILLFACGEAGVESDISKTTEVSYTVTASDFPNTGSFAIADLTETIDPSSDDFAEYLDDIQNYFINKIEVQITGYTSVADDPEVIFFGMGAGPVGNSLGPNIVLEDARASSTTPLITQMTNTDDELSNSERMVIFDRKTPANGLVDENNAGVMQILTALTNKTAFEGRVQVALSGVLSGPFTVTFFFDLTGRVQLD